MQTDVKTADSLALCKLNPSVSDTTARVIQKIIAFTKLCGSLPLRLSDAESVTVGVATALANGLDEKLQSIGADIEYLAEAKYNAPTDKQLMEATNEVGQNLQGRIDSLIKYGKAELEEVQNIRRKKLDPYASFETHPIQTERWALWAEKEPEIFFHWHTRMEKVWVLERLINDLLAEARDVRRPLYEKRSEAIMQTLKDVGVRFADPDSIHFSSISDDMAVASLKKAVRFYPQLWVDASNSKHLSSPLVVKTIKGRANYSAKYEHEQSWSFPITDVIIVTKPKDWKPDLHDIDESRYMDLKGADTWRDPLTRRIIHHNGDENKKEGTSWALIAYEYYEGEGTPTGSDWEKIELYKDQNPENIRKGMMKTYYRKPLVHLRESHRVSLLTISGNGNSGDDAGMITGIHEFAHRVDHSITTLMTLEQCFLQRRGGNYPVAAGEMPHVKETPSLIAGREGEYGYKGGFPRHYMGRVYSDNDPQNEILSTGMETLFIGVYGGFAGVGQGNNPDVGYKRFILGMLAACANDNT